MGTPVNVNRRPHLARRTTQAGLELWCGAVVAEQEVTTAPAAVLHLVCPTCLAAQRFTLGGPLTPHD